MIAALALVSALARADVAIPDPILAALAPELDRNLANLVLPGQPRPYYLAFSVIEARQYDVAARWGDLVQDEATRNTYLHARIRVGDRILDNTNFVGYGWGGGGSARLTVGDGTGPVVRDAWLAADAAYKQAIATLAAKQAALKRERPEERAPDFSVATPADHWEAPAELPEADQVSLAASARAMSAAFRDFPALQRAEIRIGARTNTCRLLDSEHFRSRLVTRAVRVLAVAEVQAQDGTPLRDVWSVMAPAVGQLPDRAALVAAARSMAARLTRRVTAEELTDPYLGPILFSPVAAAEFVRQTFAADVSGTPTPVVAEDYYKSTVKGGMLGKFLGVRVLPAWMDLTDDPGLAAWEGTPLLGSYTVDREGVAARRVDLARNGMLLSFLMSRTPSKKIHESNGHGRIVAGAMCRAAPSNLVLTAQRGESWEGLVKQVRRAAKEEGLAFALIVRHLDEPPAGEGGPRRINVGTGEEDPEEAPSRWAIGAALDIVKVDVRTGAETPLRSALFGPIGLAEVRSLAAAGRDTAVYSYLLAPDSVDYSQGFAEDTTVSIVAPALLFPQLEVRPCARKRLPPPYLPSPLFTRP